MCIWDNCVYQKGVCFLIHRSYIIIIIIIIIAIEVSLGGSSSYTSTDKTNKNKYTQAKQYKTQYEEYKTK